MHPIDELCIAPTHIKFNNVKRELQRANNRNNTNV